MDNLEKNEQLNQLFNLYKNLLTDKQIAYFEAYYVNDYSLAEIASYYEVSRNAVFDQLKKTTQHLEDYEEKLNLYKNKKQRLDFIEAYIKNKDIAYLEKLKEMDDD